MHAWLCAVPVCHECVCVCVCLCVCVCHEWMHAWLCAVPVCHECACVFVCVTSECMPGYELYQCVTSVCVSVCLCVSRVACMPGYVPQYYYV